MPNGLELSCPAEAGSSPPILAHASGPGTPPYGPARRVSFSELLDGPEDGIYPGVRRVPSLSSTCCTVSRGTRHASSARRALQSRLFA